MSTQPTAVLVHGAFADASGYAGVIRHLQAQGVSVRAPMNPLRGLASDADAITRYTTTIDGPIVLVGHSYGGAVISQAAPAVKDVRALVYLSAFALDEGDSCATVTEPFPPSMLASTNVASPYDAPGAVGGPELFITIDQFHETFCADLSDDVAGPMAVSQRPSPRLRSPSNRQPSAGGTFRVGTWSQSTTMRSRPTASASWLSA